MPRLFDPAVFDPAIFDVTPRPSPATVTQSDGLYDDLGNYYPPEGDIDIVGPNGETLFTNNPDAGGAGGFGGAVADFVLYGVVNGAFQDGPPEPAQPISEANPLPYWAGPVQVSGEAVEARWVDDANSPSGHNLRFTINPGAAGDEAYLEQIVRIGGSRSRTLGHRPQAFGVAVSVSSGLVGLRMQMTYLDAGFAEVGSAVSDTATLATGGEDRLQLRAVLSPPATAYYLRLRIGAYRNTVPALGSATVDFSDVRIDKGSRDLVVGESNDPATYGPTNIAQLDGVLHLGSDGGGALSLGPEGVTAGNTAVPLRLAETELEHGTPADGFYIVYVKDDGRIYGKNDAGAEVGLGRDAPVSGCEVHRLSQSIGNNAQVAFAFDTEVSDTDAYWAASPNPSRVVAPFTGWYTVTVHADHINSTSTTGSRFLYLRKNANGGTSNDYGTLLASQGLVPSAANSGTGRMSLSWIGRLAAGDYVEAMIYQDSGAARTCRCWLQMAFMGS